MKEPIVLESNQNHATITNNGICPTLPASMGMGGGYVPMVVIEDGIRSEQLQSANVGRGFANAENTRGGGHQNG